MSDTPSSFLPEDFEVAPIGLIAGKGRYPELIREQILEAGIELRLVAFEGETSPSLIDQFDEKLVRTVKVGQLGKMLKALKELGCQHALMAGQITPKRLFHGLHPDLKAVIALSRLKEKNAESIFGGIASEIEAAGIRMLDARSFMDDHLAVEGVMTGGRQKADHESLEHGIRIAKACADNDIGQGAVVRKGTVLAVEAYEGTDAMLRRAGTFKTDGMIFVKTVKRQQDYRFDVPVFGSRTIETMREAGVTTAALEAGGVLILDREKVVAEAKAAKIEILGYGRCPSDA